MQIVVREETEYQLRQQLKDQQEVNEELEFRLFELEESSEKVRNYCRQLHFAVELIGRNAQRLIKPLAELLY